MSQGTDPRRAVYQHGQYSPPPSTKPTMHDSDPRQQPPSWGFSRVMDSPSMNSKHAQLAIYEESPPVTSPLPRQSKPYAIPTPKDTQISDDEEYREYKRDKERRKRMGQTHQQSPPPQQQQQAPPPTQQEQYTPYPPHPQGYHPYPPNHFPQGYPPSNYPHYQYRQPPNYNPWPQHGAQPYFHYDVPIPDDSFTGNQYGDIKVRGSAKVVMGNVHDKLEGPKNKYGTLDADGNVLVNVGNLSEQGMVKFYNLPTTT